MALNLIQKSDFKLPLIFSTFLLGLIFTHPSHSKIQEKIKYRTYFGKCPSKTAGTLTLKIVREFELRGSLRDVKQKIISDKLKGKHFLKSYRVTFDPIKNMLNLSFDCPSPLMKVQIYKNKGLESYDALLVDSGELFDPIYETILRTEDKLKGDLPSFAIPVSNLNKKIQDQIAQLFIDMKPKFRKKISEVILGEKKDLTIILSLKGGPSSVFFGENEWEIKFEKLKKIISYMEKKRKIPSIINLTNSKKVVVKFNDKF